MDMEQTVRDQIRRLRAVKGITQEYLADLLNVDVSTVGKMERGRLEWRFGYIEKIAAHFDLSIHDLIEFDQYEQGRRPYTIKDPGGQASESNSIDITLHLKDMTDRDIKRLLADLSNHLKSD